MSTTVNLLETFSASGFPLLPLVRGVLGVSALVGLMMFFKPLLTGIARALVLAARPRPSKEEQSARRQMRNAQMLQGVINSSQGPNDAAELRAMASRG